MLRKLAQGLRDALVERVTPGVERGVVERLERELALYDDPKALGQLIAAARGREPTIAGDPTWVTIDPTAGVFNAHLNANSGRITIKEHVGFGYDVRVIAGGHDVEKSGVDRVQAADTRGLDVTLEPGVWVASGATIIGPCVIGRDAVIAAGAVVRGDVPPRTVMAGIPARPVRVIDGDGG